jgi:hypothetical protein
MAGNRLVIAVFVASVGLVGCSGAKHATGKVAATDRSFVAAVRSTVTLTSSDAQLVDLGNSVCTGLTTHGTSSDTFNTIGDVLTLKMSPSDAGKFMTVAVIHLCPQFESAALAVSNTR